MDTEANTKFKLVPFLCLFLKIHFSLAADTITVDNVLSGHSTIVSKGRVFEMGFFQPGSTPNYYLGIWYVKDPSRKAVWLANREKPVSLSSELRISNGNLVLFDESKKPIWSTNVSYSTSTTSLSLQAVLLDTGNLVLSDVSSPSKPLWESFDHPTHTWLPGAKFRYNKRTNTSHVLTSWKNSEDPTPGLFSCELSPIDASFFSVWNRTQKYWISGSWDGKVFSNYPAMKFYYIYNYSFVSNENESYFIYSIKNISAGISHLEMDVSGQVKLVNWMPPNKWNEFWSFPSQQCEVYAYCGAYGNCNENASPYCSCLTGFEPKSPSDWKSKDYSGGCIRKTKLQCERNNSVTHGIKRDRFLQMPIMLLTPTKKTVKTASLAECESRCLNNCSCTAYAYESIGCSIWTGDLLNLVQLAAGDNSGRNLYIRQAASNHKGLSRNQKLYIVFFVIIATAMFTFCIACYVYYLRTKKLANKSGSGQFREDEKRDIHVPFFAFKSILAATGNFSEANKLGEGGFGPVYKGIFPGGHEMAIKRLSSGSGQGLQEFKNEVLLIAKLQHRNLVRLLGYCVEGTEQILLYEYMPNKSLDLFIFDQKLRELLNWKIRYNIILGIARGLLYLHHDSRLRIIHRDMKTSNILLDEEMNPKISDFGMARIFGGKQTEANTNRVAGTYGYMSPEYALDGLFSIKSDVFSFGVVMLEIIIGKRTTGFYHPEQDLSLIGYVWKLWKENNALVLMDSALSETCNADEFVRCVQVGLLCVQDDPNDRPTMSNVVVMLESESASLPSPKQPIFVVKRPLSSRAFSSKSPSNIGLTDTSYQDE